MTEKVLIENEDIRLVNYTPMDDRDLYDCWQNLDTQKGYNYIFSETFDEFIDYDRELFPFYEPIMDMDINELLNLYEKLKELI